MSEFPPMEPRALNPLPHDLNRQDRAHRHTTTGQLFEKPRGRVAGVASGAVAASKHSPAVRMVLYAWVFLAALLALPLAAAPGDEHWDAQFGLAGPGVNTYAITTHNGRIYASGLSSSTNISLEVWDGAQWSALSQLYGPVGTTVNDLAFLGETLYMAGTFTNIDGVALTNLAKWNGTNWSSVGFTKGTPYSLAVDGANLYVGGGFTNVGG